MSNVVNLRVASEQSRVPVKDCRDCKWCDISKHLSRSWDGCSHPSWNPPAGKYVPASVSRRDGHCGLSAVWFEAKPIKPTLLQRIKSAITGKDQ